MTAGIADLDYPNRASQRWVHRALQVALALFLAAVMSNWRFGADAFAVLSASLAMVLLAMRPPVEVPRGSFWLFAAGLAVFLVVNVVATMLAKKGPGFGRTGDRYVHVYEVSACLAAGLGLRSRRSVAGLIAVLLVFAGIWHGAEWASLAWRGGGMFLHGRLIGFRKFHSTLGLELLLLAALFFGCAGTVRSRWFGGLALGGGLVTVALLVLTQTRLALLALGVVVVPVVLLVQRRWGTRRQRAAAVCAWWFVVLPVAGLGWWLAASPERRSPRNIRARWIAWETTLHILRESPRWKVAVGHGCYGRVFPALARRYGVDLLARTGEELPHAHSAVCQTLLESGGIGLAALVAVWLAGAWRVLVGTLRNDPDAAYAWTARALLPVVLGVAVLALGDRLLKNNVPGLLSWFLVGLAFASARGGGGRR